VNFLESHEGSDCENRVSQSEGKTSERILVQEKGGGVSGKAIGNKGGGGGGGGEGYKEGEGSILGKRGRGDKLKKKKTLESKRAAIS